MANFYNKKAENDPANDGGSPFVRGDDDRGLQRPQRRKLPPSDTETSSGAVGTDNGPTDPQDGTAHTHPSSAKAPPTAAAQSMSSTNQISDLLASGSLMSSPYYQQILANQTKLTALKAMPTYVNKRGETVQGMEDKDGRVQSGLKALVHRLARMGPTPDWASLGAGVAGSVAGGVAGAAVPEWNEWNDRNREIERLENETQSMMKQAAFHSQMATQEVSRRNQTTRVQNQTDQLAERKARNQILNLKDEQAMALEPIMKRGYYYEGDNPDEDAKLAKAGVLLPDFDNTRKPVNDNGQQKAWNPQTRSYELAQGTTEDPDEKPMTFEVDGKPITASTKWFLNYAAAKERQTTSQAFQASQQEDQQQHSEKIANANKQMTSAQLLDKLTRYADDNGVSLDRAKEAFRKAGVQVDEILKRQ